MRQLAAPYVCAVCGRQGNNPDLTCTYCGSTLLLNLLGGIYEPRYIYGISIYNKPVTKDRRLKPR